MGVDILIKPLRPNRVWQASGPAPIDPATLALDYWWEANDYVYDASGGTSGSLPGKASVGGSGVAGRTLIQLGPTTPTVGPVLFPGKPATVHFLNTSSQVLRETVPAAMPNSAPFSGWVIVNWDATGAATNGFLQAYNNEGIFGDFTQNRVNWAFKGGASPKAQFLIYDGAFHGNEVDIVPGTPQLLYYWCDGTNLKVQNVTLNTGWVAAASGFMAAGSAPPQVGSATNPGGAPTIFYLGDWASLGYNGSQAMSDATFAGIRAYLQAKWGAV